MKRERWLIYSLPSSLILIALCLGSLSYPDMEMGGGDLFQRLLNSGCLPFPGDLLMFPLLYSFFNVQFLSLLLHLNSRHRGTIHHDLPKQSPARQDLPMSGAREAVCPRRTGQQCSQGTFLHLIPCCVQIWAVCICYSCDNQGLVVQSLSTWDESSSHNYFTWTWMDSVMSRCVVKSPAIIWDSWGGSQSPFK